MMAGTRSDLQRPAGNDWLERTARSSVEEMMAGSLMRFVAARMMASARRPALAIDISDDVTGLGGSPRSALAFDIEMEGQGSPIPKGLEKRLAERSEIARPYSNEEIDQKLILAEKRRKEFLDWLSNKAKPKQKSPVPVSFSSEELAAKLEARLSAAEAKRTELLARDQDRLAAYFASHEQRLARRQGSAERRWDATWQRLVKAEQRRAALLEAERGKAAERYLQAREIARAVLEARDQGARARQEKLEEKLVRASTRRQQLQQERGSLNLKRRASHGDKLSRKLARHWKAFRQQNKTTAQLAEEFQACDVSQGTATKLPFERFAGSITSAKTVKASKELLARLETRLLLSDGSHKGTTVEHLLRRLSEASRPRRSPSPSPSSSPRVHSHRSPGAHSHPSPGVRSGLRSSPKGVPSPGGNSPAGVNTFSERYPARVFLCAFMILGHQEAVFNERGPREAALTEASKRLLPLFEELVITVVERNFDSGGSSPRESYDGPAVAASSPRKKRFAEQLKDFDSAWLHYLDQFVAWKVKDLGSLEGDLIKVALQLESSMHQYTKALHGEDAPHLTPDQEAIRVQVSSDQGLLRERINRLTGEEGLARMEAALETLRARFIQQRAEAQSGNPLDVPVEIVQVDSLGNRIGSEVSGDVSGRTAPVVGGLSAAFGGKAAEAGGQISGGERTPPARSGFKFSPSRKPAPLEVPADEPSAAADARSSRGSGKSPIARRLFGGKDTGTPSLNQEGYAPLFTLGKSPVLSRAPLLSAATETLPRGGFENIHMVHELLYDPDWRLMSAATSAGANEPDPDDPEFDVNVFKSRLGVAMEKAFWDSVKEKLVANPPDWARVVGLVAEVRGELEGLVPAKWKEELTERMDTELLQQILENNPTVDYTHLLGLLHYAADVIIRLGAPARDEEAKASLQALLSELSSGGTASSGTAGQDGTERSRAADTVVKGLRYVFERLRVLKRDVSNARLRALAPVLQGSAGVDYERRWFIERYPKIAEDVHVALPRTVTWLADVSASVGAARTDHEAAEAVATAAGLPGRAVVPLPPMRTGLSRTPPPRLGEAGTPPTPEASKPVDWTAPSTLVKLGLLRFASLTQGVTEETLPETLQLDTGRIREVQNGYQRVLVMVTGLLLTRQVLASRGVKPGAKLEAVVETAQKRLANLLDNPAVNLAAVGKLLAEAVGEGINSEDWADVGEKQMTSLLAKATRPDDAIFFLVGKALTAALRGAVFAGAKTPLGKALALIALKRAGASLLVEDVLGLAEKIGRTADINSRIHGDWYTQLLVDEI
ncbi:T-complex protein 11 [Klebsormidium nitens]|uniref:T-complex protein 11 n=1 Tax=Klebsormidium nitens TaxID=105231 RepID=A0A1Y1HWB9_KLENI|nr:T-complex protein 11 [Klebsormidium nitens]|eukprot:GAQ81499.1 T-complex protein 11 [Klebsormidium nitens]